MDIGQRIRAARKRAGLSQEEVARRAGMSLKGMAYIERGHIEDPHYSSLAGIAEALGVSVGELLGEPVPLGEASEAGQSEEEQLDTVDAERQNRVDRLAKMLRDLADERERVREAPADAVKAERLAQLLAKIEEAQGAFDAEVRRAGGVAGVTEFSGKAIDRERRQKTRRSAEDAGSEAG